MPHRVAKQIYTALQEAERIVLVPHENPDGDAAGSVSALAQILDALGKDYSIFCVTEASKKFHYIKHINTITTSTDVFSSDVDCIVVCDSGDLRYAGIEHILEGMDNKPKIINIDHHKTNEMFGDLNLVVSTATSTTAILYTFCKVNRISITPSIATSLLTGLITDTYSFTNSATKSSTMSAASDLIQAGGNLNLIKGWVFKDKSVDGLRLWGTVLSRLQKHDEHDIVYTYLTLDDLSTYDVSDSEVNGIADFMTVIGDGKAGLILKELPDNGVKGSFRTTNDNVDVAHIAKQLGGGGHQKAAGFTIQATIEETFEKIWELCTHIGAQAEA